MINLKHSRKAKFAGVSTLALAASVQALSAGPAFAQQQPATVEEVIISGSRVIRDGTQAPTPVSVISAQQLQDAAPRSLVDGLSSLPVFRGNAGVTTATTGSGNRNGTGGFLNLRNIGSQRTLTLLDGRRLVPTGPNNYIDLNILPQSLVSRIDVVTGGASAAYGSDAVAGVVNLILDKRYEGIKGFAQSGISRYDDAMSYKAGITVGKSFADGRGHFLFDAGKMHQNPVYDQIEARDWAKRRGSILAGNLETDVRQRSTFGGLILPPTSNCPLIGGSSGSVVDQAALDTPAERAAQCLLGYTQFLPGGTPAPFDPGEIVPGTGVRFSGTNQIGGDGIDNPTTLVGFNDSRSVFTRTSFDLSDNLNIYAEALYGVAHSKYKQGSSFHSRTRDPLVIFEGNPFIPAPVAAILATSTPNTTCGTLSLPPELRGVTTPVPPVRCFQMVRHNHQDYDRILADIYNEVASGTVGFTAMLGDWQMDAYYTHGENRTSIVANNPHHFERTTAAADAVLVNGQIICNVLDPANPSSTPALRAQYAGCVPLNPFGVGSPSDQAIGYVTGSGDGLRDSYHNDVKQDVVAVSVQGEAWEGWGAGPINVAGGLEARKQTYVQTSDPQSQLTRTGAGLRGYPAGQVGLVGSWVVGNQQPSSGTYKIWEGFVEAAVPLARDTAWAYAFDLNLAGRYTHYDRSGGVNTWKVGLTYAPIEDLRFRGTVSRDVREPTLNELFQGNAQGGPTVRDTVQNPTNPPAVQIFNNTVGNSDLTVESADTVAFGVVYQPSWLPGFSASVDYYSIEISDAIATLAPQRTIDNCAGLFGPPVAADCDRIIRSSAGQIARIITPFQNLDSLATNGVDIEFSYRHELFGGQMTSRLLVGYLGEMSETTAAGTDDTAGTVGNAEDPKWQANLSVNYDYGPFTVFVQQRYIDAGFFDQNIPLVGQNHVRPYYITNMSAKYRFGEDENYEAFINISNLFNHDPPPTPQSPLTTPLQANAYLYDTIGTYFTGGIRFKF